uniref:Extracellular endo-1,5-alpha-L-arabinase, putative n=1 Tax=Colletotrichum fructicola (strain Nara gc5) TaxID=1213859 RepID=L2FLD2_COLFN
MRFGSVFSLAAALLSATVQAYGNPGACSGQCWSHDPSVVRRDSDGTYFRFETGSKIGIWKAPDLVGPWTYQGAALPSGSKINLKGNDDLWTGGNYYLNFGSFWSDIFQVPMTNGGVKANGNPYNIVLNTTAPQPVEGAFVYERSGTFWAFFSSGSCCGLDSNRPSPGNEYKIFVCHATSVAGPYTDKSGKSCTAGGGTLLLPSHDKIYAPGGQGVLVDPKRGAVLYYHYMNTDIGYADSQTQFGWNVISWSGGWPSV